MDIRSYRPEDYPLIKSWWDRAGEPAPLPGMLPKESTFVLELGGVPALCISVYLTNTREVSYLENFAGNPDLKGPYRKAAGPHLLAFVERFAGALGYKRLLCMSYRPQLKQRYGELGYQETLSGVSTFVKEL